MPKQSRNCIARFEFDRLRFVLASPLLLSVGVGFVFAPPHVALFLVCPTPASILFSCVANLPFDRPFAWQPAALAHGTVTSLMQEDVQTAVER
jgi:hypothetical protein